MRDVRRALGLAVLLLGGCGGDAGTDPVVTGDRGPAADRQAPEGGSSGDLRAADATSSVVDGPADAPRDAALAPADAALVPGDRAAPVLDVPVLADSLPADALRPDALPTDAAPPADLPLLPDVPRCPPCPLATTPTPLPECTCLADAPWPAPSPGTLDSTFCLSADIPRDPAYRDFFFAQLARLGIGIVRHSIRWHWVEAVRGQPDWSAPDAALAAAEAAGVEVLAMLGHGNQWASARGAAENDPYYPPDDPRDFGAYAASVAGRYAGRLRRYEIWNEQNAGYRFWKGALSGDPAAYAALLREAHAGIRTVEPTAPVAFGGLISPPQIIMGAEEFVTAAYAADPGLGASFEALAYHPYPPYPPQVGPEARHPEPPTPYYSAPETAARLDALVVAHEGVSKPLWVTEYGWPTLQLAEEEQARFLVREHLLLIAAGVELACIYTLMDGDPEVDRLAPWEGTFGLLTWDPTPGDPDDGTASVDKVAGATWARLHTELGATRFTVDLGARHGLGEGRFALGFTAADASPRAVLWTPGEAAEISLPWASPAPPTGMNLVTGEASPESVVGLAVVVERGLVRVPATGDPIVAR